MISSEYWGKGEPCVKRGFLHMADLNKFYRTAAPVFLLLGIGTIVDQYIPGLTLPGDPMTWAAFAIACALVASNHANRK